MLATVFSSIETLSVEVDNQGAALSHFSTNVTPKYPRLQTCDEVENVMVMEEILIMVAAVWTPYPLRKKTVTFVQRADSEIQAKFDGGQYKDVQLLKPDGTDGLSTSRLHRARAAAMFCVIKHLPGDCIEDGFYVSSEPGNPLDLEKLSEIGEENHSMTQQILKQAAAVIEFRTES